MAVEQLELESRPPLTVEEFEALAEREGWSEDTRVELLDGELVWMSPTNDPHIGCVNRLNRLFHRRYPEGMVLVSVQHPVRLGQYDEPEPDLALLTPRADDYGSAKATPSDILLLIEVADRTLRTDLGRKARIYASADVAEYWVIDLKSRTVRASHADGRHLPVAAVLEAGATLSAGFAPDLHFSVAELVG